MYFDFTKVNKYLMQFCHDQDLVCLDLLPYMTNSNYYYSLDGHWNEKGHLVAGGLLATVLEEKFLEK